MKTKFIILIIMVLSIQLGGYAQNEGENNVMDTTNKFPQTYLGLSVDPMQFTNGFKGDEVKGTQWIIELGVQDKYSRVSLFYERFDAIEYISYGLQPSLILPVSDVFHGTIGSEFSIIRRPAYIKRGLIGSEEGFTSYATYAFNMSVNASIIKDRFDVFIKGDMKRRPDINNKDFQYETKAGVRVILN
jgi:hypothetical protein